VLAPAILAACHFASLVVVVRRHCLEGRVIGVIGMAHVETRTVRACGRHIDQRGHCQYASVVLEHRGYV